MELQGAEIAMLLSKKDEAAFEQVFKSAYKNLHAYAYAILKNVDDAEEMVQQVFFKLWERGDRLTLSGSITAYLYRAVHNESLNFIKHKKVKADHQMHVAYSMRQQEKRPSTTIMTKEMEQRFRESLNELPEQCRTVFQMSRFEDLRYREIADRLNISVKTVENHMGKALKFLRSRLTEFLSLALLLLKL